MDWRYEMKKMLMAIDFQASHTLDNIKFAFKRTGYSFDQNFKQYFLDASIEQWVYNTSFEFSILFALSNSLILTLVADWKAPIVSSKLIYN